MKLPRSIMQTDYISVQYDILKSLCCGNTCSHLTTQPFNWIHYIMAPPTFCTTQDASVDPTDQPVVVHLVLGCWSRIIEALLLLVPPHHDPTSKFACCWLVSMLMSSHKATNSNWQLNAYNNMVSIVLKCSSDTCYTPVRSISGVTSCATASLPICDCCAAPFRSRCPVLAWTRSTWDLQLQCSLQKWLLVLQGHLPFLWQVDLQSQPWMTQRTHDYNIRNHYH